MTKKVFRVKTRKRAKVYLESHRGRRSEPAELCGLRKQVTEANKGPSEVRKKAGKENAPSGRREEKTLARSRECEHTGSLV